MQQRITSQGFGLVEVIVAVAIVTIVFTGLFRLVTLEIRTQAIASQEAGAYLLAREALEATRSVRDENWGTFAALSGSTPYYPVLEAGEWTLSPTSPGAVGIYARHIEVEPVYRDGSVNIAESGSLDEDTRKVTAYVSWTSSGSVNRSIELTTYFTNWQEYK
ncbi:MAG: prepilin-type N-terminal cleavage/methylation domain-containing protein [Candidatus Spechtbacterales bacterium]